MSESWPVSFFINIPSTFAAKLPSWHHSVLASAGTAVPTYKCFIGSMASSSEQAASGLGIEAQRATACAYADRKGLTIVDEFCDEGISAKTISGRPGALAALKAVRDGKAAGLLVAKMDRLSRSVVDGAGLVEAARREGWSLHFADLDIDTGTPAGEMAANIIISGSQYERRLISQRTRDALAAKRARGERLGAIPGFHTTSPDAFFASEQAAGRTKRLRKA
jgi:DNA invertase Pin-like site-specific DNA recombinase